MAIAAVDGFHAVQDVFGLRFSTDVRVPRSRHCCLTMTIGGGGSEGSKTVKKVCSKNLRSEPLMAVRDQHIVCALTASTVDRVPGGAGLLEDEMNQPLHDRQFSPAGDSATTLERSLLETQWALSLADTFTRVSAASVSHKNVQGISDRMQGRDNVQTSASNSGCEGQVLSSGRPSARSRRLEARQKRLSSVEMPCPMETFMIHPVKKNDKLNKFGKIKREGIQDYLSTYLREIGKIERLSMAEELLLSQKLRNGHCMKLARKSLLGTVGHEPSKDEWASHLHMSVTELDTKLQEAELARDRLVMANLRLVVSVVKQYTCEGLEVSDLIQEGSIGLLKGVEKFDHTRGYKLSTYVHWWIRQGVTRAIADHSRTLRLPVHVHDALGRIRRTTAKLAQEGSIATIQNLSEALNITRKKVKSVLKVPKKLKSLDVHVGGRKCLLTGDKETFHNIVADQDVENQPWAVVEKALLKEDIDKLLRTQLGVREQEIIKLHYGVGQQDGCSMSLECISHRYGVSRERVRQLERGAKQKLQITGRDLDKCCHML